MQNNFSPNNMKLKIKKKKNIKNIFIWFILGFLILNIFRVLNLLSWFGILDYFRIPQFFHMSFLLSVAPVAWTYLFFY